MRASIFGSSTSRFSRLAVMETSRFSRSAFFAAKKASCAALNRAQSLASSFGLPRPAAFQESISALKRRAVATQSVDVANFSASSTIAIFAAETTEAVASREAKWVRRRLSNLFRAAEKRFQRSASAFLSRRGALFHSSRRVFKRSPVAFQFSESANDSASTTIFSFSTRTCSRRAAFNSASACFFASNFSRWPSINGSICSTDAARASRSPTPLSSRTC